VTPPLCRSYSELSLKSIFTVNILLYVLTFGIAKCTAVDQDLGDRAREVGVVVVSPSEIAGITYACDCRQFAPLAKDLGPSDIEGVGLPIVGI
jgi:hypothetical protein